MLLSKCTTCDNKVLRFIKEQEAIELSSLGIKTRLLNITLLGYILY